MRKMTLDDVKQSAAELSAEDRIQLWHFLSDLPDSGIQSGNLVAPETNLRGEAAEDADPDLPVMVSTDTSATLFLKGREILNVTFRPENFRLSKMEVRSWKDAEPTEKMKQQIQEIFRLHGAADRTEEEIIAACKKSSGQIFEAATLRTSNEFAAKLKHFVWLLYDGGMKVVEIGWRNDFARESGQSTMTLEAILKDLEPCWKEIKTHLNLSAGGRQNVKHEWSVVDHACLSVHYERLKPIWRGAKKAAKQALAAKENSRRKNWKDTVLAAYRDEELPLDLIEQLGPMIDAPPSDLALIHASRLCVPVSLSLKTLKAKLKKFNPASTASQMKGSSLPSIEVP